MNYDVIILVLSSENEPYKILEYEGIRKTWYQNIPDNVKVIFYYGNSDETKLIDDKLYVKCDEGLMNVGKKTIEAFEFVKGNFKFKYLFRTNSSSYVDVPLLLNYLESKPNNAYYSGVIGNHGSIVFCSGAGYILTSDLVDLVLNNQNNWNHNFIDDVSLGELLTRLGVSPSGADRFDVTHNEINIPLNYYHYRVKDNNNRFNDIVRLHKIHKLKGYEPK